MGMEPRACPVLCPPLFLLCHGLLAWLVLQEGLPWALNRSAQPRMKDPRKPPRMPVLSSASMAIDMSENYRMVHAFFDEVKKPSARKQKNVSKAVSDVQLMYPASYSFARRMLALQSGPPKKVSKPADGVKLLIITISMAHQEGFREVHRRTWMNRTGICRINSKTKHEPKNCTAFVTFVVGRSVPALDARVAAEAQREGDICTVDAEDVRPLYTAESGSPTKWDAKWRGAKHKEKDFATMIHAAKHWPWISHVAKNDLDNYPVLDLILADISDPENLKLGGSHGIPPKGWDNASRPIFYGNMLSAPQRNDTAPAHSAFMQGQFWIVSKPLLACLMGFFHHSPMDYVMTINRASYPPCHKKVEGDLAWGCYVRRWTTEKASWNETTRPCPLPWWVDVGPKKPARWHVCKP